MGTVSIDAQTYKTMISSGAANLRRYADEINDLNVFPIPDGDTGINMLMTMTGGVNADTMDCKKLCDAARKVADSMLLCARGNSGVILSQFFDGIAAGLDGKETACVDDFSSAVKQGVEHAYAAVVKPTEGTILTVAREAADYASMTSSEDFENYISSFLSGAKESLEKTPDLLSVLKEAGVVDSGGAGLIRIFEGISKAIGGETDEADFSDLEVPKAADVDISKFTSDSVLEFGYCTEALIRLQNAKVDIPSFDINIIKNYLEEIGDSVVTFKKDSIVKLHVHTKTPDKVLSFCQRFGEFLTIKVENMSLQHNSIEKKEEKKKPRSKYATVTVASGEGLIKMFGEMGADCVINGGQSMNPSTKDFISAFEKVNADTIFVFPNNSNIILSAKQAAEIYKDSDVRVIGTRNIGEGHSALSMINTSLSSADEIEQDLKDSIGDVVTAGVSVCSRNTRSGELELKKGSYIGFVGNNVLSCEENALEAARSMIGKIDFTDKSICIILCGKESDMSDAETLKGCIERACPGCEAYVADGGQEIFNYILIIE